MTIAQTYGDCKCSVAYVSRCTKYSEPSPYPLISHIFIFTGMAFLSPTFGIYFVVNRLDRKIERQHVKNGYRFAFWGCGGGYCLYCALVCESQPRQLAHRLALIMLHQKAVLSVIIPLSKKNASATTVARSGRLAYPASYWLLDPGSAFYFSDLNLIPICFAAVDYASAQLGIKHAGQYNEFYSFVRRQICRPVPGERTKVDW